MDKQFDELSKSLAEGVSRREGLRNYAMGLAGVLLAVLGLGGSVGAGAQGSTQCGTWHCSHGPQAGQPGHKFTIKTCDSPRPNPSGGTSW